MKVLVYYTIGYKYEYMNLIEMSIKSLQHYHGCFIAECEIDVVILADYSIAPECKRRFSAAHVISSTDSDTSESASMRKLDIFKLYDLGNYDKVLFIDSDILLHGRIDSIIEGIRDPELLYVFTESTNMDAHNLLYYSLMNYTIGDREMFKQQHIHVFNAGLFGFVPSERMKQHFAAIQSMITSHTGHFFYEQSFMNVYFNKNNKTDRKVINSSNYVMFPLPHTSYEGCIIHFCGGPGDANTKYTKMKQYIYAYMPKLGLNL